MDNSDEYAQVPQRGLPAKRDEQIGIELVKGVAKDS